MSLASTLCEFTSKNIARFHMPGHKGIGMEEFFLSCGQGWDVTELSCTDDLHHPQGVIKEAQDEYARATGAKNTFFLTNGSSSGVIAMMLAMGNKRVLMGRNAHRSAIAGAALAGVDIGFFDVQGEIGQATPKSIEEALIIWPAQAVLVTSPNYYGLCADLTEIAKVVKKHGALLLVDAAHGAHFSFSEELPASPAGCADLWVESVHKTMDALGSAAVLHRGSDAFSDQQLRHLLKLVQSSSPSYLLMASLEYALRRAQRQGVWDEHIRRVRAFADRVNQLEGIRVFSPEVKDGAGRTLFDSSRLVIDVTGRQSGIKAARSLEGKGIFVEMADLHRLVLITTPDDPDEWYERLLSALKDLEFQKEDMVLQPLSAPVLERVMGVREAVLSPGEAVPLEQAAGRIVSEVIGPYPPGTVAIAPGERLNDTAIRYIQELLARGISVQGVMDDSIRCVGFELSSKPE